MEPRDFVQEGRRPYLGVSFFVWVPVGVGTCYGTPLLRQCHLLKNMCVFPVGVAGDIAYANSANGGHLVLKVYPR